MNLKKTKLKRITSLSLSLIIMVTGCVTVMAKSYSRIAKITEVSGTVKVLKSGSESGTSAFKGMSLVEGDTIKTGKNSSATLLLDDDKELKIDSNTTLAVSNLKGGAGSTSTGINLLFGQIWTNIKNKLGVREKFEIKTPTAVMGVRGTMFGVRVRQGKSGTQCNVVEGTVSATSYSAGSGQNQQQPQTVTQIIPAGFGLLMTTTSGSTPPPPAPLTPQQLTTFELQAIQQAPSRVSPEILQGTVQELERRQEQEKQKEHALDDLLPLVPVISYAPEVIGGISGIPGGNQGGSISTTVSCAQGITEKDIVNGKVSFNITLQPGLTWNSDIVSDMNKLKSLFEQLGGTNAGLTSLKSALISAADKGTFVVNGETYNLAELADNRTLKIRIPPVIEYNINEDSYYSPNNIPVGCVKDYNTQVTGITGSLKVIADTEAPQLTTENYSTPVPGSVIGTTKISNLSFGDDSTTWYYKVSPSADKPALDSTIPQGVETYEGNQNIEVIEGNILRLYAVVGNKVKAYKDLTIESSQIYKLTGKGITVAQFAGDEQNKFIYNVGDYIVFKFSAPINVTKLTLGVFENAFTQSSYSLGENPQMTTTNSEYSDTFTIKLGNNASLPSGGMDINIPAEYIMDNLGNQPDAAVTFTLPNIQDISKSKLSNPPASDENTPISIIQFNNNYIEGSIGSNTDGNMPLGTPIEAVKVSFRNYDTGNYLQSDGSWSSSRYDFDAISIQGNFDTWRVNLDSNQLNSLNSACRTINILAKVNNSGDSGWSQDNSLGIVIVSFIRKQRESQSVYRIEKELRYKSGDAYHEFDSSNNYKDLFQLKNAQGEDVSQYINSVSYFSDTNVDGTTRTLSFTFSELDSSYKLFIRHGKIFDQLGNDITGDNTNGLELELIVQ